MATPPLLECEQGSRPGADLAGDRRTFLEEAAGALARARDAVEIVHQLTLSAVPVLADWCTVHLFGAEGHLERMALVHRDPSKTSAGTRLVGGTDIQAGADHPLGQSLASGRPVVVPDIDEQNVERILGPDDPRRELYDLLGVRHSMVVPLVHEGESLGALTLTLGDSGRTYTPTDALLVEALAQRAAPHLVRLRSAGPLSQRQSRRFRRQAALAALGQMALDAKEVTDLLQEAVQLVHANLDAEHVAVFELEEAGLRLNASCGWPRDREITVDLNGETGVARAARTAEPVLIDYHHAQNGPVSPTIQDLVGAEVQSALNVAIRHRDGVFGVLGCHSSRQLAFSAEDANFVIAMANVLGAAVARADADAALRAERERLRLALEAGRMGTWEWDMATGRLEWSATLEAIFGVEPGGFGGRFEDYISLIHPDDRDKTLAVIQSSLEAGRDHYVEHRIQLRDGSIRWISGTGSVVTADDGRPVGMTGIGSDITERKNAEVERYLLLEAERQARAEAETERDRLSFLAEASTLLGASLDVRVTMTRLAHLAVPRIADWCAIELADGSEPVVAHVDASKVAMAKQLRDRYPQDDESTGARAVIRSGQPELYPEIPEELLLQIAKDDEHLRLLRELRLESAMVVPLIARGHTLGAITLIGAESGRRFRDRDLEFAMDLARRAALAIDNAVLFRQRSEIATTLQRSLLPPVIPDVPHLAIAPAYQHAGADGDAIGGDFYDIYEGPDGAWLVCMGDACGKGLEAAALTGLVRHTLRAIAMREASPAAVLAQLNDATVDQFDDGRFCTAVYARVEPSPGRARVTLATGGHPPPIVVRATGAVEAVRSHGLLIGAVAGATYSDVELVLDEGDSLLLYTDGVTEARSGDEEFGEDRLLQLARSCAGMTPSGMLGVIQAGVSSFAPGTPRDDMALLAVQVRPVGRASEGAG